MDFFRMWPKLFLLFGSLATPNSRSFLCTMISDTAGSFDQKKKKMCFSIFICVVM
jgi:hypothetical protein